MTTEKSPRSRSDGYARAEEADRAGKGGPGEAPAKPLSDVSHAASLDEETNIPGTVPVPPARGESWKGGGQS